MKYGIQLYSIRDIANESLEKAFRTAAELGYEMVESAGFFGHRAEEVRAMLDHYGLTLCSTHTSQREVFERFERTMEYHKRVGCSNIILPAAMLDTREQVDYTVACINRYQPILEAEGISLHFHNHSAEFLPNKDGQIAMDELAERTRVLFEIDTFWAANAGVDPMEALERYKGRMSVIHLKDGLVQDRSDPTSEPIGRSLGLGMLPIAALRQKAIDLGLSIVVESEDQDPTGEDEIKRCIDYLKSLEN